MVKRFQFITVLTAVLGLAFLFMACGSGGGGGDVTYEGSTDPAVADSTTAPTLAEFGMGVVEAGFPLVTPFVTPPSEPVPASLSAQPLIAYDFTTTVILPVPDGAVIYGDEYGPMGSGTADINGTLTMLVGNSVSATADLWYVIVGELDGSLDFDGFRTEEGPDLTGKATVPYAMFYFDGPAEFSVSEGNFTDTPDNPGTIIWQEVEMTFTNITVSDGEESWSLGEGDWYMEISVGSSVTLDIYSQTVEYDGSTYKLEDTNVYVEFGVPDRRSLAVAQPLIEIDQTAFYISGIGESNGTFYHPELGVIYYSGNIIEENGEITGNGLSFYDGVDDEESTLLFDVDFAFDETYNDGEGATYYNLFIYETYQEKGYFIDGTFLKDDNAPWIT